MDNSPRFLPQHYLDKLGDFLNHQVVQKYQEIRPFRLLRSQNFWFGDGGV